jgi:hypothetical protein
VGIALDLMADGIKLHVLTNLRGFGGGKKREKKHAPGVYARGVDESNINDNHAMGTPRGRIMDIIIRFSNL